MSYFARHGQSEANLSGLEAIESRSAPLTATGRLQAEALGETLLQTGADIRRILSSSMRRSIETAEIVGRILGVAPESPKPGFDERAFPDGTRPRELMGMLKSNDPRIEPIGSVAERFSLALLPYGADGEILVVSHKLAVDAYFESKGLVPPGLAFAKFVSIP